MTFQAYIDNIRAKTGKMPDDFMKLAKKKGLMTPENEAAEIVSWLKDDFDLDLDLGRGHAMAIYALLKPHMGRA